MKPTHTPTPWSIDDTGATKENPLVYVIGDRDCVEVASRITEDDAAFIVRACNNFDDMLRLLKECRTLTEGYGISLIDDLDEAIAKAKSL